MHTHSTICSCILKYVCALHVGKVSEVSILTVLIICAYTLWMCVHIDVCAYDACAYFVCACILTCVRTCPFDLPMVNLHVTPIFPFVLLCRRLLHLLNCAASFFDCCIFKTVLCHRQIGRTSRFSMKLLMYP